MTTQGQTIIYGIEDLRRVFELYFRAYAESTGRGELTEVQIQGAWEEYLVNEGLAEETIEGGVKPLKTLSDVEIEGVLLPLLDQAQNRFIESHTAAQQGDPQRAIRAWEEFLRKHVGTQGLGRVSTTAEAQQRAAQHFARRRQDLFSQGVGFLQANITPGTSLEYRQFLEDQVSEGVDAFLAQEQANRDLGTAPPDFPQFMAPRIVNTPSERQFRSQQALGGGEEGIRRAAIQEALRTGLLSSASPPEEIDSFLKELLPEATNFAALREQETAGQGQPFDFLEALGIGLQQASQRRTQRQELERTTRAAAISGQKRASEQAQRQMPLGNVEDLPLVLQDFLRTPLKGDDRAQLEESFFREFLTQQPRESLAAFTRPKPGFAQLSQGDQDLLEGVAQGKFPQWEGAGGPSQAANELFGFLNQGQQKGFQPFDLEGFVAAQRQRFTKERLPQIDLESFMPKSSRPQRVGRNIFLRGGL